MTGFRLVDGTIDNTKCPHLHFIDKAGQVVCQTCEKPLYTVHAKLIHAVTEYDRQQSTKRGYNIWALPQYCKAVQDIDVDLAGGMPLRVAIVSNFNGRLMDRCLKAVGLPQATDNELRYNRA